MPIRLCTHDEDVCSCETDCNICGDGECSFLETGTCFADCSPGGVADWIRVCARSFLMGSLGDVGEERLHEVTLTHDFVILSTEVTRRDFSALMRYDNSYFDSCVGDCPVEMVNWHEAAAYCNALSESMGLESCYECEGSGTSVECERHFNRL